MSVATLLSIDEYLATAYEPDCEYVDGELEERNVGKIKHSEFQALLAHFFIERRKSFGVRTFTEQRLRISAQRVRVPDLCVLLAGQARPDVLDTPPFLCIEILSPEDSMSRMMARLKEYLAFGVPNIWVIDPIANLSYTFISAGLVEARDQILRTIDPGIEVPMLELFAELE